MKKIKLLDYLLEKELVHSEDEANKQLLAGNIFSQNKRFSSLSEIVTPHDQITLRETSKYVSRGGEKLASVFPEFDISISDKLCLDCGASTGGFSDFLLQHEAKSIITVDVNYGMLAHSLRVHPKVIPIERTNIRELDVTKLCGLLAQHKKNRENITLPVDIIVADLSFISLRLILPVIRDFLTPTGDAILLFKPQFEAPKDKVPFGGIIDSEELINNLIENFISFAEKCEYKCVKYVPSKVKGTKGNQEFFFHLKRT